MIVGQDFDTFDAYQRALANGGEDVKRNATWRNLLALLAEARIEPKQCFFTNAWLGLRKDGKNTGRFPGAKDRAFTARCQSFMKQQLALVRPSVVLCLGTHVPSFFGDLLQQLAGWRKRNLSEIDRMDAPLQRLINTGHQQATFVALTHPSLRNANVWRRAYMGHTGHAAELQMLRDAR